MARPERYFVGPNKRNEINEVISRVNGTPMHENGAEVPTRPKPDEEPVRSITRRRNDSLVRPCDVIARY